MSGTPYFFIGIDGGGSKTLGVLMDAEGRVRAERQIGPSAIVGLPPPEIAAALQALVADLAATAAVAQTAVRGIGVGLSGIDYADELPQQHAAFRAALHVPAERLTLVNDGIAALWGASTRPAAVILQHGSAPTSAYRRRFGAEQLYDHLDAGSLFDLRHELVAVVARMIDGRRTPTALRELALAHYGVADPATFAEQAYRRRLPCEKRRTGHQVVFAAWQAGDPAATELVRRAADDYALTACAMVRRVGVPDCDVVFGGGVITPAPAAFQQWLTEQVQREFPRARVHGPRFSPACGAAVMAAVAAGMDPEVCYRGLAASPRLA